MQPKDLGSELRGKHCTGLVGSLYAETKGTLIYLISLESGIVFKSRNVSEN